jgi:hypothetical protein
MAKTINKDIDIYADKTGGYAAITRSLVDCELLTTKDGDYFIDRSFTAREEWPHLYDLVADRRNGKISFYQGSLILNEGTDEQTTCTFAEFIRDNSEDGGLPEEFAQIAELPIGQSITLGGGAAPTYTVKRIS